MWLWIIILDAILQSNVSHHHYTKYKLYITICILESFNTNISHQRFLTTQYSLWIYSTRKQIKILFTHNTNFNQIWVKNKYYFLFNKPNTFFLFFFTILTLPWKKTNIGRKILLKCSKKQISHFHEKPLGR